MSMQLEGFLWGINASKFIVIYISVWELVCIARRSGVYQTESNRKEQSSSPKYHPSPGPRLTMMSMPF